MERARGSNPRPPAWEAGALPLSYARALFSLCCIFRPRIGFMLAQDFLALLAIPTFPHNWVARRSASPCSIAFVQPTIVNLPALAAHVK